MLDNWLNLFNISLKTIVRKHIFYYMCDIDKNILITFMKCFSNETNFIVVISNVAESSSASHLSVSL